jgi:PAS domain S-box-containing protein
VAPLIDPPVGLLTDVKSCQSFEFLSVSCYLSHSRGKRLSSQMRRLQNLLDAVPDALVGIDQAGVIRFVNQQTESLFGYDRDHLVGQPVQMLVPEYLREVDAERRPAHVADPGAGSMELDLPLVGRQQDGTELPVTIRLSPIDTGDLLLVITVAREMTRHEQALGNSGLLAAIVKNSNDAIIAKTLHGIVTFWNPAATRMYGYSSEAMLGKSIDQLSPEGRSGEMVSILARIKAGQPVEHLQTTRVRKDGTVLPVLLTVSPIRDQAGAVVGASSTTRDLTKKEEAFDAARSMIESSLDALVAISPEGLITDANKATVKVTGIPRVELIGTAFSECFTEPEKAKTIYHLVFEQGMAVDYPLTMRHRDGTLTEVLYNASVYRDAGGKVLGVFAAARDVTQARQAFESARSMIESSLDALVAISPEGLITDANEATVKVTGIPRVELIGTAFSECFTEPEKAKTIYQLVFERGMAVDYPLTMRHRDGTLTEVLYNASVYRDAGGKVLGVFAAARDVTNQNRAQKEIAEQRVTELDRLAELENFQRLTVGRELKMIELKKEIEQLQADRRRGGQGR